jgi:hypothetical protein
MPSIDRVDAAGVGGIEGPSEHHLQSTLSNSSHGCSGRSSRAPSPSESVGEIRLPLFQHSRRCITHVLNC